MSHDSDQTAEWTRIEQYLLGTLPAEEARAVQVRIASDASLQALVRGFEQAIERSFEVNSGTQGDLAALRERVRRERVSARAADAKGMGSTKEGRAAGTGRFALLPNTRSSHKGVATFATFAAAIIVAFNVMVNRWQNESVSYALPSRTYTTHAGEHRLIRLADGSTALLGPATTLRVSEAPAGERERRFPMNAMVDGVVLFRVVPHTATPFRVHLGTSVVDVLGTTFSARQYATDKAARVVVVDGKISVRPMTKLPSEGVVLSRGMAATLSDSGEALITSHATLADDTAWTSGRLVFQRTPLPEILSELSRAYDLDIHATDSAMASYTFTFDATPSTQPIDDVLDGLVRTLNAHYTRTGRTITILPGRAARSRHTSPHLSLTEEHTYGR